MARRTVTDYVIDFAREESGGGPRYKPGTYKVKIVSAKPVTSSEKRTPGIELKLKILSGKNRGRTITEKLWATPKAFRRFRSLLEACGKRVPRRVALPRVCVAVRGTTLYVEIDDDEPEGDYDPRSVVTFDGFMSVEQYEEGDEDEDFNEDDEEEDEDDEDEDEEEEDDEDEDEDDDEEEEDEDDDEEEEDEDEDDDEEEEPWTARDLKALSNAELKEVAESFEVEAPQRLSTRSKPRLIKAILAAQEEAGEDDEEEDEPEEEPAPRRRSRRASRRAARRTTRRARRSKRKTADEDEDDDLDLDDL